MENFKKICLAVLRKISLPQSFPSPPPLPACPHPTSCKQSATAQCTEGFDITSNYQPLTRSHPLTTTLTTTLPLHTVTFPPLTIRLLSETIGYRYIGQWYGHTSVLRGEPLDAWHTGYSPLNTLNAHAIVSPSLPIVYSLRKCIYPRQLLS